MSRSGLVVTLNDGSQLHWDPKQLREPANLLIADGAYESGESEVLRRLAREVGCFVDVGANTGYFTIMLARANSDLRSIAIESVAGTRAKLEANLQLNGLEKRVTVVPFALGDRTGSATMFLPLDTGSVGSSLRDLHPDEESGTESVQMRMLDDVVASAGSAGTSTLVKIDVEGAEELVLAGARTLLEAGTLFVIELSRKWLAEFGSTATGIVDLFDRHGYYCYSINSRGEDASLLTRIREIDSTTVAVNFLFSIPAQRIPLLGGMGL